MSREDAGIAPRSQEPLSLTALVRDVVETMTPLADAKGLTISFEGAKEARVLGDAARLRQVFYNILDNAIKYTAEKGAIAVVVSSMERTARVVIGDSGIGIPAEHLPHVFERFYRVDKARSRAQGGAGLGLSIAKSIVGAHQGNVELRSASGKGTTCTITLPLADAASST
jgi:signal transduction histidine kinase